MSLQQRLLDDVDRDDNEWNSSADFNRDSPQIQAAQLDQNETQSLLREQQLREARAEAAIAREAEAVSIRRRRRRQAREEAALFRSDQTDKAEEKGEVTELEQTVGMHVEETEESSTEKRKAEPVSWQPEGSPDALRWKKHKREDNLFSKIYYGKEVLTEKLKKKMLDKEVPYNQIPVKDLPLYHKAVLERQ